MKTLATFLIVALVGIHASSATPQRVPRAWLIQTDLTGNKLAQQDINDGIEDIDVVIP
jgi:hypothetical protein